ncbi:cytochrome c1 [Litoreibacter roseus]|uniref:Cytochrome c1 n=1 Tax=Litoreibacter roseus TaxID=2601869 RepID=A0A6N6JG44_9RHOB|nr:cytochrome c1 [Litoreibacter roseus]GFE64349.1 cytochrome c [Litoreibacter roseus]
MLKKLSLAVAMTTGLVTGAHAAGGAGEVTNYDFSFEGPFGTFDEAQLQRGLQVYTEVCSACHGLRYVPFRTLTDLGYSEEQVRAYAAQFEVYDEIEEDFREAAPTDHFPMSQLENAPDLSLMAKARAGFHGPYGTGLNQLFKGMGGAEYIASLNTGYTGGEKEEAGVFLYENTAYGGYLAMAQQLYDDGIEYADGTPATIEQQAKDVAAFLMWTAEPKLVDRKQVGFLAVFFLSVLSVLLYLTNKRIWANVKNKD